MARKKAEKVGIRDLITFAKAGWTPEETNALLDRLEQIGDPNDPPAQPAEEPEDEPEDDLFDDPEDEPEDDDEDVPEDDDEDVPGDGDDLNANMEKLKKLSLEVENDRLKRELKKLQDANKHKDVSKGENNKSPEENLIDAFQSCFN